MASIKEIESDFKKLAEKETLAQGYIFFGPDMAQAFLAAHSIANYLETKQWEQSQAVLFDALVIDGKKQDLGVDVAREFSSFLYKQPVASQKRTLIVHAAGDLTTQAQNALLKIAEEPPKHALIILVVRDLGVLLPPLLSRFQKLYISAAKGARPNRSEIESQADELVRKFLGSTAKGRSDMIKELATNEKEILEKGDKMIDTFVDALIEELAKKPELNWRALKALLYRQTAMGDYSTNKRLQLESVLPFIS